MVDPTLAAKTKARRGWGTQFCGWWRLKAPFVGGGEWMEWKRPSFGWAFSVAVSDVGDSVGDFGVIIGNGGEGFLGRVEGGGCPGSWSCGWLRKIPLQIEKRW